MLLPPPIPSPISFQQILLDPSSTHTRDIIQADAARAKVRTVLKATRKVGKQGGKGEGGDWNAGVKVSFELVLMWGGASTQETDSTYVFGRLLQNTYLTCKLSSGAQKWTTCCFALILVRSSPTMSATGM